MVMQRFIFTKGKKRFGQDPPGIPEIIGKWNPQFKIGKLERFAGLVLSDLGVVFCSKKGRRLASEEPGSKTLDFGGIGSSVDLGLQISSL